MSDKIKYVLVVVGKENADILNNIPEENIIQEMISTQEEADKMGHPIIYQP